MSMQTHGAIAAGHEITAQAAAEILRDGGNAFDAVVAGLLAACVCEPVFASLGGGGFLMTKTAESTSPILYDFFSSTPLIKRPEDEIDFRPVHATFGTATQEFHIGLGSSATPGFGPGIAQIHKELCSLPLTRLAEPAIRTANQGFKMTAFQAYLFTVIPPILQANEKCSATFAPSGELLKENERFANTALADTLSTFATEGETFVRSGELARTIAEQSHSRNGHLSIEDLETYQVVKRNPLTWFYKDASIALNPAPAASGPLIAFSLAYLEQTIKKQMPPDLLAMAQSMIATNTARENWTDMALDLENPEHIKQQLKSLEDITPAYRGTTHISVIDQYGNAAAATVTNGEGNGHMVGDYGFMLNNMLGEEDLNPKGFHQWKPGTRLSTMMAPTLLSTPDGTITALGSGGSNRIRTAILQVISNLIDHSMDLKSAVEAPRMHIEKCGKVSFENCFDETETDNLLNAYPSAETWPERNFFFGGVNAVQLRADGNFATCADSRRSGKSIIL